MLNPTAELLRGRRKELLSMPGTVYVPLRLRLRYAYVTPTQLGAYLAMRRLARFCAIAVKTLLSWLACATS
jgi:hypothetical protein